MLKKWQSLPSMIPVVLELLKEHYNGSHSKKSYSAPLSYGIQDYEKMLDHWKNLDNLNPIQKKWLHQIGSYIEALQKNHTIFTASEKFSEDIKVKNENSTVLR